MMKHPEFKAMFEELSISVDLHTRKALLLAIKRLNYLDNTDEIAWVYPSFFWLSFCYLHS